MSCELCPACSTPLLHDPEIALPDWLCALTENGELAGNVPAPGIAVAVCAKPSELVNCTNEPTATVVCGGANPAALPCGICVTEECSVRLTSIFVTGPPPDGPPAEDSSVPPGVQAESTISSAIRPYFIARAPRFDRSR